ncbi:YadA-like family protein [Proteus terrae]|uniref:YadA-like family protein n=1 Tax=Proteus terrae TaxID=1574161 RepID=UPI001FC92297|nr:YadA-like family protein [Proteus terrae]MCT8265017.1 YadA-like family protein [Proteus terrae]
MKYKKIFIIGLSLIYSANAFSNKIGNNSNGGKLITLEYDPLKEHHQFVNNPLFDKIVSDSYVKVSDLNKNTYEIKLDKRIAIGLANHLKEKNIRDAPEYIKNNIVNSDRHIEIKADDTLFKSEAINYFTSLFIKKGDKNLSLNRDKVIDIIRKNKTIIITSTEKPGIDLAKINNREDLYEHIDNIETKNSSLFILDENIDKKINQFVKNSEQEDHLINNLLQDYKQRTKEEIEFQQKKIKENTNDINQHEIDILAGIEFSKANRLDITANADAVKNNREEITDNIISIEKNKNKIAENESHIERNRNSILNNTSEINEIKENTINDVNINGIRLHLKSHLSHLYNEQSTGRSQFNALKENFEHFKSDTQNRFYKVEKRANQGIASVAAMSNLPFTDSATFSTAIGIGNYRNATALAWGMQYRINENIKVRASTAWNESNWVSAGGVGISW